ncbi:hypothetical protein [Glycomyces salinus]|uniref:hypothetical protein n=1 Tax=Glycomyces salinus TaxID=980294 RepID=UPI0018ED9A5F|nr:hypothetical protein [Glycomyces salinus]
MGSSATRRLTSAVVLGLGLAFSAGCALNRGEALAEEFKDHWADTQDVAQIDTTRNDTLPFVGEASGTLILEEGTSADRTIELANELSEYLADHGGVTGRITVDDFSFNVVADEERTEEILGLWQSLETDGRVQEGDIGLQATNVDYWAVDVSLADSASVFSVLEGLAAEGDTFRPFSWAEASSLRLSGGSSEVETNSKGDLPAAAIAAYEAVAAEYPVVGAYLATDRVSIQLEVGSDVAHAQGLARAAAPSLGQFVEVIVDGT